MSFTNKYFNFFICTLIVSFPLLTLTLKHASGVIFLLLALIGLFLYPWLRKNNPLQQTEILLIFSFLFFVFVAGFAILLGDDVTTGYRWYGKFLRFAFAIPLFLLLRRIIISEDLFWKSLAFGAIISGIVAFIELYVGQILGWGGGHTGRASGVTHPILFGDISLTMGIMSFCGLHYFHKQKSWISSLPIGGLAMGLLASFMSGARGSWIAIPALLLFLLWFLRTSIPKQVFFGTITLVVALPLLVYIIPGTNMSARIDATFKEYNNYLDNPVEKNLMGNPVGIRLEMWQASWTIFKETPLLGKGWGNYQSAAQKLVKEGKRNQAITQYRHPHNQYLSSMVSSGIAGLTATLFLFFIPIFIFYRVYNSGPTNKRPLAASGMVLVIAFAHFALTEGVFERNITINFYSFYLVLITALILRKSPNNECVTYTKTSPETSRQQTSQAAEIQKMMPTNTVYNV